MGEIILNLKISAKVNIALLLSLLTVVWGCQTPPSFNKTPQNTTKPVESTTPISTVNSGKNDNNQTQIEVNDEMAIKDLLNNNPDFFPTDVNGDEDASQATVPNNGGVVFATVPNNGGVVFVTESENSGFKTMATSITQPVTRQTPTATATPGTLKDKIKNRLNRLKDLIPANWSKRLVGEPKKTVEIKFDAKRTLAEVNIKTVYTRELLFKKNNNELKKIVNEIAEIKAIFIKENKTWKIDEVSPVDLRTEGTNADLALVSINLKVTGKDRSDDTNLDLSGLKNRDNLFNFSRGDILTIEVNAINKDETYDPPIHAFVRIPGTKVRVPLFDDGSQADLQTSVEGVQVSGDKTLDDDIYTANIVIRQKTGVNHLTIDLIAGGSFENLTTGYSSISKSIPIIIK
jgi:hypothetical protein